MLKNSSFASDVVSEEECVLLPKQLDELHCNFDIQKKEIQIDKILDLKNTYSVYLRCQALYDSSFHIPTYNLEENQLNFVKTIIKVSDSLFRKTKILIPCRWS